MGTKALRLNSKMIDEEWGSPRKCEVCTRSGGYLLQCAHSLDPCEESFNKRTKNDDSKGSKGTKKAGSKESKKTKKDNRKGSKGTFEMEIDGEEDLPTKEGKTNKVSVSNQEEANATETDAIEIDEEP